MTNVAFIPARGGSKSIPLKNIKLFNNKPLIYWAITAAKNCVDIDEVYVATDSIKIAEIAIQYGATIYSRSAQSSTDTAPTEVCMFDFAQETMFDKIVLIQATSPLITKQDLNNSMAMSEKYDSVLSVVESKRFFWQHAQHTAKPLNYNPLSRPRRQEMPMSYVENGALYITTRSRFLETGCRISGTIGLYIMPQYTYFELDEPEDWILMEKLKHD